MAWSLAKAGVRAPARQATRRVQDTPHPGVLCSRLRLTLHRATVPPCRRGALGYSPHLAARLVASADQKTNGYLIPIPERGKKSPLSAVGAFLARARAGFSSILQFSRALHPQSPPHRHGSTSGRLAGSRPTLLMDDGSRTRRVPHYAELNPPIARLRACSVMARRRHLSMRHFIVLVDSLRPRSCSAVSCHSFAAACSSLLHSLDRALGWHRSRPLRSYRCEHAACTPARPHCSE